MGKTSRERHILSTKGGKYSIILFKIKSVQAWMIKFE